MLVTAGSLSSDYCTYVPVFRLSQLHDIQTPCLRSILYLPPLHCTQRFGNGDSEDAVTDAQIYNGLIGIRSI